MSSSTSNCINWSWTVGVSSGVSAAFSQGGTICDEEKYWPKFYSDDGHHAGIWSIAGNCLPSGSGNTRKASVGIVVRVGQGKAPLWSSAKRGANAYTAQGSC